jgi:hypothetical protein
MLGRLLALVVSPFSGPIGAAAETPPDLSSIRSAVVIVLAKGVLIKLGNAPAATQGTGFFISKDGFLVTSYHLRTELGEVDDSTVAYEIHFGPTSSDVVQAAPVYVNPMADLMVLYASVADRNVQILAPASRTGIVPGSTPIYTVGYPAGYQYSVDTGIIKSWGSIDPIPIWTTNLTFKSGQSGSPIVLSNLHVLAIAKANDVNANSIGLVVSSRLIPDNYWDGTVGLTPAVAATLASGDTRSLPRINVAAVAANAPATKRKEVFTLENSLCEGSTTKSYRVTATPGWEIDPNSVKVEMLAFTGVSAHYAISERNGNGFTVSAELQNIGQCVHVLNTTIDAGVAAKFTGQLTYDEHPKTPEATFVAVSSAAAIGNVHTPLPNVPLNQLKFSVAKPSGEVVPFTPVAGELSKKNGVLTLDNLMVEKRIANLFN